ncbi:MAG: DNA-binding protein WhiA [Bacillota bacterium]|nr:DNA-binding protein WhiA [Bacillota bacterium]
MSFSLTVKNELCRLETTQKCCLLSELAAVIGSSGVVKTDNGFSIRISTENAAFARRIFSIIKKLYNIYPEVLIRRCKKLKNHISYTLLITLSTGLKQLLDSAGILYEDNKIDGHEVFTINTSNLFKKACCRKSFLRGAFLAGGSLSDPEKTYHLEIASHNRNFAVTFRNLADRFGLKAKIIRRKGSYVAYIKEGENIVDFLNIIGAHSALMDLENVRILKEMRNNVNRIVNCETANLGKTVNASLRQIENIRYIKDNLGFDSLPENLREIAEIRLNNSDANLKELGEMLNPPLGKSGVNHRLRRLDSIAEDIRSRKGE